MKKNFFLDTSVLIHSPQSILSFEDNTLFICAGVLNDLHKLRDMPGEVGRNAKEALHILATLPVQKGTLQTPNGGEINIYRKFTKANDTSLDYSLVSDYRGIVVTLDDYIRLECVSRGIPTQTYKTDSVPRAKQYTGRCHLYLPSEEFDTFASAGCLVAPNSDKFHVYTHGEYPNEIIKENYTLVPNEFVVLHDINHPSHTTRGRCEAGSCEADEANRPLRIVKLRYYANSGCKVYGVHAKNDGQIFALEALMAPASEAPLVILKGPAGTAKTFLAMAAALEQTVNTNTYSGIIISRPNVQFDDGIGYLPGTERQKTAPLNRPVSDNIKNLSRNPSSRNTNAKYKDHVKTPSVEETLLESDIVSTEAMSYMRGRSICDSYIFIDEAQNATRDQIIGLITRPGNGTKIVIVGDPDQIDNKYLDHTNNGLVAASEAMRGSPLCWQVTFADNECVRSDLAIEAIKRFS